MQRQAEYFGSRSAVTLRAYLKYHFLNILGSLKCPIKKLCRKRKSVAVQLGRIQSISFMSGRPSREITGHNSFMPGA